MGDWQIKNDETDFFSFTFRVFRNKTQALIKAKFQWDDKNYKKNLRKVKIKATHMVILWDEETNRLDF